MSRNKYKATSVWYDSVTQEIVSSLDIYEARKRKDSHFLQRCLNFDSYHEYQVFLNLRRLFNSSNYDIHCHSPFLIIKPAIVFPRGKTWKIDFVVTTKDQQVVALVEAKGVITKDFPLILACLEINQPKLFNELFLVFNNSGKTTKKWLKTLKDTSFGSRIVDIQSMHLIPQMIFKRTNDD
jgi:hypothetical protein